jgi:type I restriction enzyme S subunit
MKQEIKERVEKIRKGEVPEGYKKTKVGIIPVDWRIQPILSLSMNGIKNGIFNDPKKVGSGIKLINVVNF